MACPRPAWLRAGPQPLKDRAGAPSAAWMSQKHPMKYPDHDHDAATNVGTLWLYCSSQAPGNLGNLGCVGFASDDPERRGPTYGLFDSLSGLRSTHHPPPTRALPRSAGAWTKEAPSPGPRRQQGAQHRRNQQYCRTRSPSRVSFHDPCRLSGDGQRVEEGRGARRRPRREGREVPSTDEQGNKCAPSFKGHARGIGASGLGFRWRACRAWGQQD